MLIGIISHWLLPTQNVLCKSVNLQEIDMAGDVVVKSIGSYCPETVLIHSAFLLAHKEAEKSLSEMEKGGRSKVAQIVSETIREVTSANFEPFGHELLQTEIKELEFQIHSWIFTSFLNDIGLVAVDQDDSAEEDFFHSFPPLPPFGVEFYLELVHEIGWQKYLVEVGDRFIPCNSYFKLRVMNSSSVLNSGVKKHNGDIFVQSDANIIS